MGGRGGALCGCQCVSWSSSCLPWRCVRLSGLRQLHAGAARRWGKCGADFMKARVAPPRVAPPQRARGAASRGGEGCSESRGRRCGGRHAPSQRVDPRTAREAQPARACTRCAGIIVACASTWLTLHRYIDMSWQLSLKAQAQSGLGPLRCGRLRRASAARRASIARACYSAAACDQRRATRH